MMIKRTKNDENKNLEGVDVTPEMIEAGQEELRWYDEGDLSCEVVARIYRAMHAAGGQFPEQPGFAEILLKLRYPDGHWVVVFENGRVDGVPEGTVIFNRYPVLIDCLRARQMIEHPNHYGDK